MTTLRDMPMITIEQKNRFREAALQVEAERDALAAHVDRMSRLIFDTYAAIEDGDVNAIPYDEARKLHNASPTTSLARRDLLMKTEALEEAADMARDEVWQQEFASLGQLQRDLASKAAEYRKQAEGEV